MKKILLVIIPLLIFIGCEDEKEKEVVSQFVGVWDVTFIGTYEEADCTGEIDSTEWNVLLTYGFEGTLALNRNGTYAINQTVLGNTQTFRGNWEESVDGRFCVDEGNCMTTSMAANGGLFILTIESDAYCEEPFTYEETEHTDSTSCTEAGNDWIKASCSFTEYTKR